MFFGSVLINSLFLRTFPMNFDSLSDPAFLCSTVTIFDNSFEYISTFDDFLLIALSFDFLSFFSIELAFSFNLY